VGTIFDLHERVLSDYRDFVHSFIQVADERAQAFIERALLAEERLWPEPLVQISPAYRRAATVEELAERGLLHPETARVFRTPEGRSFLLYEHQVAAIEKAARGESFVVTSGTGSGKSFTYFIPIMDAVVRDPELDRPVALIVYPMNALVNSQLDALKQLRRDYMARTGRELPLRFARYTGETSEEERREIRRDPPHILLTNYMMVEMIMVRPEDRGLLGDGSGRLFLVFDELHTYRGRQGADVAMLVRRLRARMERSPVLHVGTSATMVAHRGATPVERRRVVAEFASRFFGHPIGADQVIEETLEPVTQGGIPADEEVRGAFGEPLPESFEAFRSHPLARWVEFALGVEAEAGGRLRRRVPRTISDAARDLAAVSGRDEDACRRKLREVLLHALRVSSGGDRPIFAFKLHRFISQGRAVYATLEPLERRSFTLDPPVVGEDEALWAPLRFCRICGQDHYQVVLAGKRFRPLPPDARELPAEGAGGYLTPEFPGRPELEDVLPPSWYDRRGRLSTAWRARVPRRIWVRPDGSWSSEALAGGTPMWWQPERFWLCLRCGESYTAREAEYTKLASLSSEGRSSATTALACSLLLHARKTEIVRPKLLTFTDNRQDASLQAGHFNDFVHLAVLRSALLRALEEHGELRFDNLAAAVVRATGLGLAEIAENPSLDPGSPLAKQVWGTFEELTELRLYEDLRRGWRVVQPNLEDVGLLRIEHEGLAELAEERELVRQWPALARLHPEQLTSAARMVLDYFRKRLAIETRSLSEAHQQRLRRRSSQFINEYWGLDQEGSELREAAVLVRPGREAAFPRGATFKLTARSLCWGGPCSAFSAWSGTSWRRCWTACSSCSCAGDGCASWSRSGIIDGSGSMPGVFAGVWGTGPRRRPIRSGPAGRPSSGGAPTPSSSASTARPVRSWPRSRRGSTRRRWWPPESASVGSGASGDARAVPCRTSSAPRPWSSAWTSPSSTRCTCATCRPRRPTTRSAADARAGKGSPG
jgi:hypothetical protein